MAKVIQIKFENGEIYQIPAHIIADHRSKYYAKTDKDTTYKEEYDYVMEDEEELIDWAQNNMNWVDVKEHAKQIKNEEDFDYQSGWVNPEEIEVLDID